MLNLSDTIFFLLLCYESMTDLKEFFPDKWIGTDGPIAWSAHSTNTNELLFMGHSETVVYALDEFKVRTTNAIMKFLNSI